TLMRLFKKQTGLSYRGWIQQMHIALALSKIADGQSMSSIAEALGYSSPSAFSAMFKRHLGITPQQFKSYEAMKIRF
ncbi:helix-turn-helix domain-containing protein, partial [uncultured Acinetobacter sp.]|uniref:helix-turn-helix domain-containing protein n=1 Tax=uncultured Acinetobacter sp. TaxID=165433 RepID=UPI003749A2F9